MTKSILRKLKEPMAGRRKDEELVVITKTYDLILWSCNHTSTFPRNHSFVQSERLDKDVWCIAEAVDFPIAAF